MALETSPIGLLLETHDYIAEHVGSDAVLKRCEIKGVVEANDPLHAPYSQKPCVAYDYYFERQTARKKEQRQHEKNQIPFWVRDSTGRIQVDPTDAWIELPPATVHHDEDDIHTEQMLAIGQPVYVLGWLNHINNSPTITHSPSAFSKYFVISWQSEAQIVRTSIGQNRIFWALAIVLAFISVGIFIAWLLIF